MMGVEWEKTMLQELDITATDLSTECLIDMLTRIPALRSGQSPGYRHSGQESPGNRRSGQDSHQDIGTRVRSHQDTGTWIRSHQDTGTRIRTVTTIPALKS